MSEHYLLRIGTHIRSLREKAGLSRRQLATASNLSERFLSQLELGQGNISLSRFVILADALSTKPSVILSVVEQAQGPKPIALLGVRGAGKSTVGAALAAKLNRRFVELDREIEHAAGLTLGEIFEVHGESHYRKLEREVLTRVLADDQPVVLATGGSIVTDPDNFGLLRTRCVTVWLKASAEDHWKRVIAQGDARPMAKNPHAFEQLRALVAERTPAYNAADVVIDTSRKSITTVVTGLAQMLRLKI
jgi:XRE family transcriptional regulator, aerobic/anaerobic benzoate catabolism transcriptional regulator